MKQCPKCGSSRIRRGYAYDPILIRMLGFRELLCDGCNLRFRGFVIPGTLPRSNRHKKRDRARNASAQTDQPIDEGVKLALASRSRAESKRCPGCDGDRTHRSHRRGVAENLASLIGVYPYRCDDCNKRFPVRRSGSGRDTGAD